MHVSQHKQCTRKTRLALEMKFYLGALSCMSPWRRTLIKAEVTSNAYFCGAAHRFLCSLRFCSPQNKNATKSSARLLGDVSDVFLRRMVVGQNAHYVQTASVSLALRRQRLESLSDLTLEKRNSGQFQLPSGEHLGLPSHNKFIDSQVGWRRHVVLLARRVQQGCVEQRHACVIKRFVGLRREIWPLRVSLRLRLEWSNSNFPLQPHQKYYITQYEELGFLLVTFEFIAYSQMKDGHVY